MRSNRQSCRTCCCHAPPRTLVHAHLLFPVRRRLCLAGCHRLLQPALDCPSPCQEEDETSPPPLLRLSPPPAPCPSSPLLTHNTWLYRMSCACHAGFPYCLLCPGNRKFTAEPRTERLSLRVQSSEETPPHTRVLVIYRWRVAPLYRRIYRLETQMLVYFPPQGSCAHVANNKQTTGSLALCLQPGAKTDADLPRVALSPVCVPSMTSPGAESRVRASQGTLHGE